ncbi:head GIN domain-containing protein [Ramlibacter sp. PS4R-6]|uniref:head GIN domain-containing protein n=1 Tax=Ramlibacter sp. PS4R-6 TaxID=3133438 RepID=UPI0030A1C335
MTRPISRRILWIFLAAFSVAGAAAAETVAGNGVVRTQERVVSSFSGITLGIPAKVEVTIGATEALTIEADENLLPLIETGVKRGTLEIKPVRRNLQLEARAIRIVVQARRIEELGIAGAGSITAGALSAKQLRLDISGSGNVRVDGTATRFVASIAGSGDIAASRLVADDVDVTIAGAGAVQVAARSRLDVTIAGSGGVTYYGDPAVSRTIVGAGAIKRAGPLPQ